MTGMATKQNTLFSLFEKGLVLALDELEEASGLNRHETVRTAGLLINRGYLTRLENGIFTLTAEGAEAQAAGVEIHSGPMGPDTAIARPPVANTLRQRAWAAMRVMAVFSTSEITAIACDEPTKNDQDNIRRYCRGLRDAGILMDMPTREQGAAETSNGFKRYRLFNDLGEVAPSHRVRKRDVFDHNSRKAFPCQA